MCGALLAVLLALRLLSPAGFMPSFDRASVTIVACPDGSSEAPAGQHMHHRHGKTANHQPCPYASASSLGALGPDFGALLEALIFGAALLLGRSFKFIERNSVRERPPTRAPPLPA
jgi:hypothetical protein